MGFYDTIVGKAIKGTITAASDAKRLRDNGLITQDDYQSRIHALEKATGAKIREKKPFSETVVGKVVTGGANLVGMGGVVADIGNKLMPGAKPLPLTAQQESQIKQIFAPPQVIKPTTTASTITTTTTTNQTQPKPGEANFIFAITGIIVFVLVGLIAVLLNRKPYRR